MSTSECVWNRAIQLPIEPIYIENAQWAEYATESERLKSKDFVWDIGSASLFHLFRHYQSKAKNDV